MKFLALSLGIAVAANATAADLMAVSTAPVADLPRGVSFSATAFAADDFIKLMMGDEALAAMLLQMFVENMPGDIERLKDAVASGDGSQIRSAAHYIKGAAANLCASGINAAACEIEQAGKDDNPVRAVELLPRLESSWLEFVKHAKVCYYLAQPAA